MVCSDKQSVHLFESNVQHACAILVVYFARALFKFKILRVLLFSRGALFKVAKRALSSVVKLILR